MHNNICRDNIQTSLKFDKKIKHTAHFLFFTSTRENETKTVETYRQTIMVYERDPFMKS